MTANLRKQFVGRYQRHIRVALARGKAREHQCMACGDQAMHWATIHGHSGQNPDEDYIPLCILCHMMYDGTYGFKRAFPRPRGEQHGLHILTEEDVRQIKILLSHGVLHREIANVFGVSRPTITSINNKKSWAWLE